MLLTSDEVNSTLLRRLNTLEGLCLCLAFSTRKKVPSPEERLAIQAMLWAFGAFATSTRNQRRLWSSGATKALRGLRSDGEEVGGEGEAFFFPVDLDNLIDAGEPALEEGEEEEEEWKGLSSEVRRECD